MREIPLSAIEAARRTIYEAAVRTPLVRLGRVSADVTPPVYVKLEWYGPSGSLKDRIYLHMFEQAREGTAMAGALMYAAVAARGICSYHVECTTLQQAAEAAEATLVLARRAEYRSQEVGARGDLQFFRCAAKVR